MQQQGEAEQARAGKAMETAASDGNAENRNKEGEYFPDDFPHSHSRLENSAFHCVPFRVFHSSHSFGG